MAAPVFPRAHHQQALHHTKGRNRSAVHHEKLQRLRGTHVVESNPKLRLNQLEVVEVADASALADSALRRVGPAEIRQLRSAIS